METNIFIDNHKVDFDKALDYFQEDLKNIRTGRANPMIVEDVQVEVYGAFQPLKQLASISVPESAAIMIEPWDKSIIKDIEKSLNAANLGLSIVNTGERIIAKVPMMTEETRKEMVKLLGNKAEEARIKIRQIRDEVKEEIIKAEKDKEITEDDKYQYLSELDNYVQELNKKIDQIRKDKEDEIMTV